MNISYVNSKFIKISTHILVWGVLFSLPYLFSAGEYLNIEKLLEQSWIPLFYYLLIFYTNYFLLIDKFLFNKKKLLFFVINLCTIGFFIWLNWELRDLFFSKDFPAFKPQFNFPPPPIKFFIYRDLISFFIPIIFSVAMRITERWIRTETQKKEAEKENLLSELQHLKYQLQPHFFFNSLNNIYSLIDFSPEKAKEAVHSLGKLMRYLLYVTDAKKVSLINEIDFMKNYIDLMALRTPNNTKVVTVFPILKQDVQIAPLLFISLIENAFKHGSSATKQVEICFELKVNNNIITFISENENFPKTDEDKSGSGIGLSNLTQRLNLLYPRKHSFTREIRNNVYWTILEIEFD
jgi:hypothetical protein